MKCKLVPAYHHLLLRRGKEEADEFTTAKLLEGDVLLLRVSCGCEYGV